LRGQVENTPCLHSRTLSQITGAELFSQFENLQFTSIAQGAWRQRAGISATLPDSPSDA